MSSEHPAFDAPDDENIKIWRYMDFTKFVAMLDRGGLFFPRVELLGDRFEGSLPLANRNLQESLPAGEYKIPMEALEAMSRFRRWLPRWTFISCWHMNETESAGMWSLYGQDEKAVALQSTYKLLRASLDEEVLIGKVCYIDYATDVIPEYNTFFAFTHKRKSFEHERELRAVIGDLPLKESPYEGPPIDYDRPVVAGVWKDLDLKDLLETVYVSPDAPGWFAELVKRVMDRYGLDVQLTQSSLGDDPIY